MTQLTISCDSCGRGWTVRSTFSVYERQAIESRPCPLCGACTLSCPDPAEVARRRVPRRRRPGPLLKVIHK